MRGCFTLAINVLLKHLIAHSEIDFGILELLYCVICQRRRLLISVIVFILLIDSGQVLIAIPHLRRRAVVVHAANLLRIFLYRRLRQTTNFEILLRLERDLTRCHLVHIVIINLIIGTILLLILLGNF